MKKTSYSPQFLQRLGKKQFWIVYREIVERHKQIETSIRHFENEAARRTASNLLSTEEPEK